MKKGFEDTDSEYLIELFEKTQSYLFWELVRILKEVKPTHFMCENVESIDREILDIMTKGIGEVFYGKCLGRSEKWGKSDDKKIFNWYPLKFEKDGVVKEWGPYMINSIRTSAQQRRRMWWSSVEEVIIPEDEGILLRDILEDIPLEDPRWKPLDPKWMTDKAKAILHERKMSGTIGSVRRSYVRLASEQNKCQTLVSNMGTGGNNEPIIAL